MGADSCPPTAGEIVLAPEDERVISTRGGIIPARPFYQAVRELAKKSLLFNCGIEEPSACDAFTVQMAHEFYFGGGLCQGGTHCRAPDDVMEILHGLFN